MLVVGEGVPGLGGQEAGPVDQLGGVGHQHAAAAGGDDLVAVEREDAGPAERAGRPAPVGGAQGLGGVLDQRDPVLRRTAR